jgi:hypothetical protein
MTRRNTGGYRARQTESCGRVTVSGGDPPDPDPDDGIPREALLAAGGVAALIAFRRFRG